MEQKPDNCAGKCANAGTEHYRNVARVSKVTGDGTLVYDEYVCTFIDCSARVIRFIDPAETLPSRKRKRDG